MTACVLSERRATRPFGLLGGQPALSGKNFLIRKENGVDRQISLGGKITIELQAGDKIRIETPGTALRITGLLHFAVFMGRGET